MCLSVWPEACQVLEEMQGLRLLCVEVNDSFNQPYREAVPRDEMWWLEHILVPLNRVCVSKFVVEIGTKIPDCVCERMGKIRFEVLVVLRWL